MDGIVHFVLQTPEIEEYRGRDELLRGEIITLRATHAPLGSERRVLVEVTQHGRLPELEATSEPSTVLDLVAVQTVRDNGGALPADGPVHGFGPRLREAMAGGFPSWKSVGLCRSQRKSEAVSASVALRWRWTRRRGLSEG
ncbi:MAG TPA: hypothetical protein VKM54_22680 [Myxococcota bacterium]|nr:hypothetical protein [Myxococcota bacterium]